MPDKQGNAFDDPDFRAWYESENIEQRLREALHGIDHETAMRGIRNTIDRATREHEKAAASRLAPESNRGA